MALGVLGWLMGDQARAQRLLDVTGLSVDELRAGIGNRAVLAALLDFLCAHEPDVIAAAEALGLEPQAIAAAREALSR